MTCSHIDPMSAKPRRGTGSPVGRLPRYATTALAVLLATLSTKARALRWRRLRGR